jgi:hypothetical protein
MSDEIEEIEENEESDLQLSIVDEKVVEEKPKSAKGTMTPAKLDNLAKAREARKRIAEEKKKNKVPAKVKRKMETEEQIERKASELAEKRALEIMKRRDEEKELEDYRKWKEQQAKKGEKSEEQLDEDLASTKNVKKVTKKKAPTAKKSPPTKKITKKVATGAGKRNKKSDTYSDHEDYQQQGSDFQNMYTSNSTDNFWDFDDVLG